MKSSWSKYSTRQIESSSHLLLFSTSGIQSIVASLRAKAGSDELHITLPLNLSLALLTQASFIATCPWRSSQYAVLFQSPRYYWIDLMPSSFILVLFICLLSYGTHFSACLPLPEDHGRKVVAVDYTLNI